MKLRDLEAHLRRHGCVFLREGGSHTIWVGKASHHMSGVPRHREIKNRLVKEICEDLGIPSPFK
jgi:predicted RNA binding protein YcfA (HicA-like mRNA interferase family)